MSKSVFNLDSRSDHTKRPLFFGDDVTVARYDTQKYPFIEKQIRKQIGFFWVPEEIALTHDRHDFQDRLGEAERHVFTSNLQYQILLDSVQGRGPNLALLPFVSCPSLETWIETWSFFETIHSRSYTHIIRNIYTDPSTALDPILEIPEIISRAENVTQQYDSFIDHAFIWNNQKSKGEDPPRYIKEKLIELLISIYILEGIRFYVSFACSWAFSETMNCMSKCAKIIKLICRDENLHMATVNMILRKYKDGSEGKEYKEIFESMEDKIIQMFESSVEQEIKWADYLFQKGSILGLNAEILSDYVKFIADKRLKALGFSSHFGQTFNPIPWTDDWITSKGNQPAPQESEITTYVVGAVDKNLDIGKIDLL